MQVVKEQFPKYNLISNVHFWIARLLKTADQVPSLPLIIRVRASWCRLG